MTITIGIDPHKASHTAVAIDKTEHVLDQLRVRACAKQADQLRRWAAPFPDRVWAIESARGLGYLLAQQLVAAGETVVDVPPVLSTRTRLLGSGKGQKNDPNDARSVAITALRHTSLSRVTADDHAQALKLLVKRHRDLGRLKNKTACRLHSLLTELSPGGMAKEMTVNRANEILDRIEINGQFNIGPTKTYSRRSVGIPATLASEMASHLAGKKQSDFVFEGPEGGPLRHSNWYPRHFKPAAVRSGCPSGTRFHDLRHTYAAFLIAEGAHPRAMMERMGHSTINVTLGTYGHMFPAIDEQLDDALDARYNRSKPTLSVAATALPH